MPRSGIVAMSRVNLFLATVALLLYVAASNPLDDYVKAPDDHYNYTLLKRTQRDNYTLHVLNMTSQKWMDEKSNNHPIWWHYVVIVVPKQIEVKDTAFLLIDEGKNTDGIPDESNVWVDIIVMMAVTTKTVAVCAKQIPNQPIVFTDDPRKRQRHEDSLVAWTWRKFLLNPNQPQALVHLAMTKAVVRAMDTVDDYSKKTRQQTINKFFIAGASKRGWTTWLTSAVDSRVIGMAPIVFDLLNINEALHHHYRSLGGWTFAFNEYVDANITAFLDKKVFNTSLHILDPITYKDRYNMPTFIIKATDDEFFLLDETRFFYNQLKGPHHLRVLPNCEHALIGQITNTILGLGGFYYNLLHGAPYPKVQWTMTSSNSSGTIHVTMNREPLSVTVYQAHTLMDGRRDFRWFVRNPKTGGKMFHPIIWFKGHFTKVTSTEYKATVTKPTSGWRAFFIELTFKGVRDTVLAFSTEVNVVPDTLPFPDCFSNCTGKLV